MALGTVSSSDSRVYLSTLSGDIYTWDMSNNQFSYQVSTGVQLTDIAIAPDGRLYGISFTGLYQIDPNTGQTVYIGALTSPTQIYAGVYSLTGANGFDIAPDGTARVSSNNNVVVVEVDLNTGQISNPWGPSLGYRYSAGDIWFTDDTTYAVSTTSSSIEYIAQGATTEFSVQSDFVLASDIFALFQAPASSTVVAPGTMVGITASNDTPYNVSSGNFAGLGPGITSFNIPWFEEISGAALHRGATGGGGGAGPSTGFSPVQGSGFELMDAAMLAHASYALGGTNAENVLLGNVSNPAAYTSYGQLADPNFNFTPLDLATTDDRGVFKQINAGAILMTKGNDLYVAFTGTNDPFFDLGSDAPSLANKFIEGAKGFVSTAPAVGLATGFNPSAVAASFFLNVGWQFVSADRHHWIHRDQHWDLFENLYDDIIQHVDTANIQNIYATGHSLGAGMVPFFINDLDGEKFDHTVGVQAINFATPGNSMVWDADVIDEDDPRVTNYWTDGDAIRVASTFSNTPGSENKFYTDIKGFYVAGNPGQLHSMEIYRASAEAVTSIGLDNVDFSGAANTVLGFDLDRALLALDIDSNGLAGLNSNGQSLVPSMILTAAQMLAAKNNSSAMIGTDADDSLNSPFLPLSTLDGFVFAGLKGDDTIKGTAGFADVFVFRPMDGNDTVENFEVGLDVIDARAFLASFVPTATASGSDLLVDLAGQGTILLEGVSLSEFGNVDIYTDDFSFWS